MLNCRLQSATMYICVVLKGLMAQCRKDCLQSGLEKERLILHQPVY